MAQTDVNFIQPTAHSGFPELEKSFVYNSHKHRNRNDAPSIIIPYSKEGLGSFEDNVISVRTNAYQNQLESSIGLADDVITEAKKYGADSKLGLSRSNREILKNRGLIGGPPHVVANIISHLVTSKPKYEQLPKVYKALFPRSVVYEIEYNRKRYEKEMLLAIERERKALELKLLQKAASSDGLNNSTEENHKPDTNKTNITDTKSSLDNNKMSGREEAGGGTNKNSEPINRSKFVQGPRTPSNLPTAAPHQRPPSDIQPSSPQAASPQNDSLKEADASCARQPDSVQNPQTNSSCGCSKAGHACNCSSDCSCRSGGGSSSNQEQNSDNMHALNLKKHPLRVSNGFTWATGLPIRRKHAAIPKLPDEQKFGSVDFHGKESLPWPPHSSRAVQPWNELRQEQLMKSGLPFKTAAARWVECNVPQFDLSLERSIIMKQLREQS